MEVELSVDVGASREGKLAACLRYAHPAGRVLQQIRKRLGVEQYCFSVTLIIILHYINRDLPPSSCLSTT